MSIRFFRKQPFGPVKMGHVPPYILNAGGGPSPPVTDFTEMYLGGNLFGLTNFGTRTVGVQGPSAQNFWFGRWDLGGTNHWLSRIYSSLGVNYEAVAVATSNYVFVTWTGIPNVFGLTPNTYTVENGDGTVGATVQTFSNDTSFGAPYDEGMMACLDLNGNVLWAKRLYQLTPAVNRATRPDYDFSAVIAPVDMDATEIRVVGHILFRNTASAVADVYTFGPGDPAAQTASLVRMYGYVYSYVIDIATGQIVANSLNVSGPVAGNIGNLYSRFQRGDRGQERGTKWASPAFISQSGAVLTTQVAANTGSPTAYLRPDGPTVTGRHDGMLALVNADRSVDWAYTSNYTVLASSGNNEIERALIDSVDGGVYGFAFHYVVGAGDVYFRDLGNTSLFGFARGANGVIYFLKYDASGNLLWWKVITETNGVAMYILHSALEFDGQVFFEHAVYAATTVTWGAGEAGQTSYAYAFGGIQSALVCVDPATGELQWVQPFATTAINSEARILEIYPKNGEIRVILQMSNSIVIDPLGTPVFVSLGTNNNAVYEVAFDATTGAYISHTQIFAWVITTAHTDTGQTGVAPPP